jgi:hypothetical protein
VSYSVGSATWTATNAEEGWAVDRETPKRAPLCSVSTDADTFWRLCTRNAKPADVAGRIRTSGDESVCAVVLTMTSIIA